MIWMVQGTVLQVFQHSIALSVGPIGLEITVPNPALYAQKAVVDVHTYMHWNAEQGPSIYGFENQLQKEVFLIVISCSGIGPKIGMAVLADLGADGFISAITQSNEKQLSTVSGIGLKKAEQIIVQTKHKVQKLLDSGVIVATGAVVQLHEVFQALLSLNYSRIEVQRAMDYIKNDQNAQKPFDQLLRMALSYLSKQI